MTIVMKRFSFRLAEDEYEYEYESTVRLLNNITCVSEIIKKRKFGNDFICVTETDTETETETETNIIFILYSYKKCPSRVCV